MVARSLPFADEHVPGRAHALAGVPPPHVGVKGRCEPPLRLRLRSGSRSALRPVGPSLPPLTPTPGVAAGQPRSDAAASLPTGTATAMLKTVRTSPHIGEWQSEDFTTRRGPAAAGLIPATGMHPGAYHPGGGNSQGQLPAHPRHVIPTHAYQSGGSPIHAAPARRQVFRTRPPPPFGRQPVTSTAGL
jgi:hypothetical protein